MTTGGADTNARNGRRLIVCLGPTPTLQRTLTFDNVTPADVNRAQSAHDYASGKGVNVARVLHALGHEAMYVGPIGGDRGGHVRRDLADAGIAADFVEVATPARLCVTVVDRARRQATELVENAGPLPPEASQALLDRLAAHLPRTAVVVLSGSLAAGMPDDFYATAVRMAREAGARTVLDTRGEPLRLALSAGPDVVKPNRAELAATVGRGVNSRNAMHEAMRAMVALGAGRVIVTRGRDGSSACDGARCWEIGPARAEVVSPIGSGDAYAAGLAVGLRDGGDVPGICRYASACGGANAESPYAGHLDPLRVAEFVGQITARPVGG